MEQKLEPYIFEGTVYKVTSANFLPVAISKLLESDPEYIGIDLEWRPDFNSGDNNPIEIIQLATETVCVLLIVRPLQLYRHVPRILSDLLTDPNILKIGHSHDKNDFKKLNSLKLKIDPVFDISDFAKRLGFRRSSLKHLAANLFGYAIDKKLATSNWSRNPLTDEQVNYAATDAYLHQRIYQELKEISENNEKVLEPPPKKKNRPYIHPPGEVKEFHIIPAEVHTIIEYKNNRIKSLEEEVAGLKAQLATLGGSSPIISNYNNRGSYRARNNNNNNTNNTAIYVNNTITVAENPYECNKCGKSWSNIGSLIQHKKSTSH
jgi:hypothetical protein